MKHLRFTTKFKKDLKRYERQTAKIGKLLKLLSFLKNDLPIPAIYKAHTLKGDYAGCMECHIEGDFLLDISLPIELFDVSLHLKSNKHPSSHHQYWLLDTV